MRKKEVTGFALIFGYLGIFLMFIGLLTGVPLLWLIGYPEEQACLWDFLIPVISYIVLGAILYFALIFKRKRARFMRYEDRHLLFLIWVMAVVAGALPFFLAGIFHGMNMNFSESIFEATSAYSTTGLTAYKDFIDVPGAFAPHVFLFHRAEMQFVGAAGLVLLLSSILSSNGGGMSLFASEGHTDRLMPNLGQTAKVIFGILTGYALVGTLALWFAGVPFFEALVIAMCALAGGGMAPRSLNIAAYRDFPGNAVFSCSSLAVEIIVMVLALLSATSFVLHLFLLKGQWKKFFRDDEVRFAVILLVLGTVLVGLGACYVYSREHSVAFGTNAGETFRSASFYVVSSLSTSGFGNTSMEGMIALGKPFIYISTMLMVIGGGVGSTGGGIKQYRIVISLRSLFASIRYRYSPTRALNPTLTFRYGEKRQLDQAAVSEAHNYGLLFLVGLIGSSVLICFLPEINPEIALFNVASGMSGTGLSMIDFPAYGAAHPFAYHFLLWIQSIGMLLGRLEIMPMIDSVRNYIEEFRFYRQRGKRRREERRAHLDM